jgi:hypothetical protein
MVMGEVSLCRVKELPPTFARELRPALAKGDPAVLSGGGHAPESCHWHVGKPFPERCQAGLGAPQRATRTAATWPVIRCAIPSV